MAKMTRCLRRYLLSGSNLGYLKVAKSPSLNVTYYHMLNFWALGVITGATQAVNTTTTTTTTVNHAPISSTTIGEKSSKISHLCGVQISIYNVHTVILSCMSRCTYVAHTVHCVRITG